MSQMNSWLEIPEHSDFSIYNLPFGIFSTSERLPRAGIAIGEFVIDLSVLAQENIIDPDASYFLQSTLNDFISLGKKVTSKVRLDVQTLLVREDSPLRTFPKAFLSLDEIQMHLPVAIGDYTDFYSSKEHATNVGKLFRDPENALLPNWKHLPVAYHGRASSIVVSGTSITRPCGQLFNEKTQQPVFGATQKLDFELEMAFVVGKDSVLGQPISTSQAEDYIFGLVLFNDWSARDIQKWEYVPLGPFLGKNFASSVSPWIVTLEALEPFRTDSVVQEPVVLPYLQFKGNRNFDIDLEIGIIPMNASETVITRTNFKHMYWNMAQQLTHHTCNGCNVKIGDIMASGTISGQAESSYGSLLEQSYNGTKPITLKDGTTRTFIEDGDTITMRGTSYKADTRVGFGELKNQVLPNNSYTGK